MKFLLTTSFLALASSAALADGGYVGAVLALTKVQAGCPAGFDCDRSAMGGQLYGGTRLKPNQVLDLGVGSVNAVQVGFLRSGDQKSNGTGIVSRNNITLGGPEDVTVPATETVQASAIYAALVANFPVVTDLNLSARLGLAYVTSTLNKGLDGLSNAGESAAKLKPYFGLGADYQVGNGFSLVASLDVTRYDVSGRQGNITAFGLGAQKGF